MAVTNGRAGLRTSGPQGQLPEETSGNLPLIRMVTR